MSELLHKLGLDWKLLLAQAVNFLAILFVLKIAIYKPMVRLLENRRKKIEQGLANAKIAEEKLHTAESVYAEKMREAEVDGLRVFTKLEKEAKEKEVALLAATRVKEEDMLRAAEKAARAKEEEAEARVHAQAKMLVREAIEKTVSLKPGAVDDALVAEALASLKKADA